MCCERNQQEEGDDMTDHYTTARDAARAAQAVHSAAIDIASVARAVVRVADAHALEANDLARKARVRADVACFRSYTANVKFNAACDARDAASDVQT
jgi:hypothetical protein